MKEMHTTERVVRNWIDENEECMKSLWLRRDGFSVHLMARTKEPPVSLLLPLDSCFDVRILRIDYAHGFVFVRPLAEDDHYEELQQKLIKHSSTEHIRAGNLNESMLIVVIEIDNIFGNTMYLVSNNDGIFRGILIGQPSTMNLFYGVDVGEMKFVDTQGIFQLPADLQSIPPLCFCGILPSCTTSPGHIDLLSINENNICLCKISSCPSKKDKILPPHFSGYPTVMYPPVVFLQLYKFISYNKYVEVIFKRKSRTITSNNEYLRCQRAVPNGNLAIRENDQSIKKETNVFQRTCKLYDQFVKGGSNGTCTEVGDFTFKPYSVKLPSQVRAIVTAKIRRNVYWMRDADILSILAENLVDPGKHSKYKSVNSVDMHNEMCCMVRLARPFRKHTPYNQFSIYRAVVTYFHEKTDTCLAYLVDFGLSVVCKTKNLYSCKEQPAVIRETSSAAFKCCVNRALRQGSGEHDISRTFPNKNEITLTSIQLDVLKISEKIDNITSAKLASLHMAMKNCGHCGRISSLQQCCQNSQNPSTPMIESIQMQQFQFAGPSNGLGIPESSYNLHGGVKTVTGICQNGINTVRNRNNSRKFRVHHIMGNNQLPLDRCAKSRNIVSSVISVIVPVAVPLQCSLGHENRNREYVGRTQNQYDEFGYKQLNGNKLKVKRTNFHMQRGKRPSKSSVNMVKKCQRDEYHGHPFTNKGILRTFYVRKLRNREGKLLYTSDESSADEISYDEASCPLITSNNGDDVVVVGDKTGVTANLLEKEIVLDMNEPVTSFIRLRKPAPIYQAFFEYVKVSEGDEVLVKRSDDDHDNKNWPLFFVQIQRDDLLDVLEEQLDSLQPTSLISEEELQVGTLCVSFCRTFDSMFRAVITNISNVGIEVHYVDYGNYETVNRDDLMSISNLSDVARTYPGMAIPCMLFNSFVSSTVSNSVEDEDELITNLKNAVSCEHHSFRIRILKIREDRICIVEYVSS
uniref:Tudor domain-containing protein n=2 Tax=Wuchereria bancrofti TaxID=6293 RepID=A0A1I8EJ08_WUCBA